MNNAVSTMKSYGLLGLGLFASFLLYSNASPFSITDFIMDKSPSLGWAFISVFSFVLNFVRLVIFDPAICALVLSTYAGVLIFLMKSEKYTISSVLCGVVAGFSSVGLFIMFGPSQYLETASILGAFLLCLSILAGVATEKTRFIPCCFFILIMMLFIVASFGNGNDRLEMTQYIFSL